MDNDCLLDLINLAAHIKLDQVNIVCKVNIVWFWGEVKIFLIYTRRTDIQKCWTKKDYFKNGKY